MAKQRLHSNLAEIDLLTRLELEQGLHKHADYAERTRLRGIDAARIPPITAQGTGGTVNLGALSTQDPYCGPEQGDVWLLRLINVVSSGFPSDPARYVLFRGSTPSDYANGYTSRNLFNGVGSTTPYTTLTAPAVPASTVPVQNTSNQPYTVTVTGGTVTAVTVNGVVVGAGDGTYTVPAFGSIAVTYSVAPTWAWAQSQPYSLGQLVGIAWTPSSKAGLLQPGEQIYAQVFNSVVGNTYLLVGDAIRVPAEMKGKVL